MLYAVFIHIALAVVAVVSLSWPSTPTKMAGKVDTIQAVVIDQTKLQAEVEKLKKEEEKKKQREEDRRREAERKAQEAKQAREREEQRLAELKKQRAAEQQKLKLAEQQRQQELKQQAELKKKHEAEEMERKRQADLDKKRKAEAEKKRREEAEQALQEQLALEQQQLEAARNRRSDLLRAQYEQAIAQKVERNWPRPATAKPGWSCKVKVNQIPGGEVIGVEAIECNGDAVFKRSVEAAVHRASPLPPPPDPALFDREIIFTFKPEG